MNLLVFLCAAVSLGIALEPLFERLRIPAAAGLVLLGFAASELVTGLGGDTGLRWHSVREVILYLLLPVLIFESALRINLLELRRELPAVLLLALPLLLVSTLVIAVLLRAGLGPSLPWIAALFAGAILSATDPASVLAIIERVRAPGRLRVLIDGESLFNDATAIVLSGLLLALAADAERRFSLGDGVVEFGRVFLGGLAVGALVGALIRGVFGSAKDSVARVAVTVSSAVLAFAAAEGLGEVSGVMAVLAAGLVTAVRLNAAPQDARLAHDAWAVLAHVANTGIFILLGATITVPMFTQHWPAMLIGVGAVLAARALVIFGGLPVANLLPGVVPVPAPHRVVLFWGGLRGAVTVALALAIPTEHPWWYQVQSVAYGVVLFTLLVQAPTMAPLLRRLRL